MLRFNGSVFFDRADRKDRAKVLDQILKKLNMIAESGFECNQALIIFPEGTCVNNEYTVLFHKGAFELGCWVCPVAIKYDKKWSDPYWNTHKQSFTQHLLNMMSQWRTEAHVYWLQPTKIGEQETAIQFAERVKRDISQAASLKNMNWDGYLKNFAETSTIQKMRIKTQDRYVDYLKKVVRRRLDQEGNFSLWIPETDTIKIKNDLLKSQI